MINFNNIDAWKALPLVEDESVDLNICDVPYMELASRSTDREGEANKIVNVFEEKEFYLYAKEAYRTLKPGRHLYYFTQEKVYDISRRSLEEAGFRIRGTLIWVKKTYTKGSFDAARDIHYDYPIQTEMIIYAHKEVKGQRPRQLNGDIHSNLLTEFPNLSSHSMIHPTQKPVPLLEYLIERSSNPGELVFDPFAGVGTTLQAARNTERNALGFEVVEEFWKKGSFLLNN